MKLLPTYSFDEIEKFISDLNEQELEILNWLVEDEKRRYTKSEYNSLKGMIVWRMGEIQINNQTKN